MKIPKGVLFDKIEEFLGKGNEVNLYADAFETGRNDHYYAIIAWLYRELKKYNQTLPEKPLKSPFSIKPKAPQRKF